MHYDSCHTRTILSKLHLLVWDLTLIGLLTGDFSITVATGVLSAGGVEEQGTQGWDSDLSPGEGGPSPKFERSCVQDLVLYKKFREKEVASAARGLITLFRELAPGMLEKRDRGRDADLAAAPTAYGARQPASRVEGADLLQAALEKGDSDSEDGSGGSEMEGSSDDENSQAGIEEESDGEGEDERGSQDKWASGQTYSLHFLDPT